MIKINPYSLYSLPFGGIKNKNDKPKGIKAFHTDDYKAFDTVVVKVYPDGFDSSLKGASPYIKNYKGYTKQDIKKTLPENVKLDARKGVTVEILDKSHSPIKEFRVNIGHDVSKNTAVLERWQAKDDSLVWIKIPVREKFVKPRAELIQNGQRVARIVLNEKGENIASERDEYSKKDMDRLKKAMKSLIDEAKAEGIEFPYDKVQKIFKGII